MTLKINSLAPDFTAETSEGKLSLHEWLGDSWGVLFSHPKAFTPVCTTELGALAKMKPEFEKRNWNCKGSRRREGKPEEMLENIAKGKMKKFFKENTLINQQYIKDSKQTITDYINSEKKGLDITDFARVGLG